VDGTRCQHDSRKEQRSSAANNKILLVTHANLRVVSKTGSQKLAAQVAATSEVATSAEATLKSAAETTRPEEEDQEEAVDGGGRDLVMSSVVRRCSGGFLAVQATLVAPALPRYRYGIVVARNK